MLPFTFLGFNTGYSRGILSTLIIAQQSTFSENCVSFTLNIVFFKLLYEINIILNNLKVWDAHILKTNFTRLLRSNTLFAF